MIKDNASYKRILIWPISIGAVALAILLVMTISQGRDQTNGGHDMQTVMRMYDEYREDFPDIDEVDAQEAMREARDGNVVFVDVRDKDEQEVSMLPHAITDEEFLNNIGKYEDRTVIAYCTISYRSGKLTQKLKEKGVRIYNLKGGMLAWIHEGGKVYDKNGATNRVHVYGSKWNLLPSGYVAIW